MKKTLLVALLLASSYASAGSIFANKIDITCPLVDASKVTVIEPEGSPDSNTFHPKTEYNVPAGHILAFKFKTGSTWWNGAVTSLGNNIKITQCAGDMQSLTNQIGRCERSTRVDFVAYHNELDTRRYCHLTTDTVFYANIVSKGQPIFITGQ